MRDVFYTIIAFVNSIVVVSCALRLQKIVTVRWPREHLHNVYVFLWSTCTVYHDAD